MKKNLAKKIVLGLLTCAVLMSSSVAWAGLSIGPNTTLSNNGSDGNTSGDNGIAIGTNCYAKGDYNIVIGFNNSTSGNYQLPTGKDNIVVGRGSEAGNYGNNGSFSGAIAIGSESKANGTNSVALGYGAVIDYDKSNSVALGAGSVASDDYVVSVGNGNGDQKIFRKIVNVADGTIGQGSHDTVTGGQLFDIYGTGKDYILVNGSELIQGKNLTEAVVALDGAVKNITTPDLSSYAKTDDVADTYATKTELNNKANASDVYTTAQADDKFATKGYVDSTFVKISNNANEAPTSGFNVVNTNDITKVSVTHVGGDNPVVISSDDGITVGEHSTRMDGSGFYVWAKNDTSNHNPEKSIASIKDDGSIKGAGGAFTVDASGNVTAEKVTAKEVVAENLYTKDDIDGMLGGNNASISGINQRLEKTNAKINKVGAGAAALAALHPLEYDPDDKLTFSAGMGNYAGENAAALGAFYRPNEKFMVSLGGTMGNGENMVNLGLSIGLDKPNGYAKLSKRELIQKVNAMEAKYEAVEAEKEAMKAEMAEMKAMLQAILAKK